MAKVKEVGNRFWRTRAKGYQKLEWATRGGYLQTFIECGAFRPSDRVLDVGTGTGIVAHAVAPYVKLVVGIDTSRAMLEQAIQTRLDNEDFVIGDVRSIHYQDNSFDKITARMVFHHVLEGAVQGVEECYRVLKPGGRMILSEGVPPDKSLKDWYARMFALKEERLTFMEEDLVALMEKGGFGDIAVRIHVSPQVSLRNWLENSGLPQHIQETIFRMHLELDGTGRKFYNMTVLEDDVLLDFKYAILIGHK